MIKRYLYSTWFSIILVLFVIGLQQPLVAQNSGISVTGVVKESGTGKPLEMVAVSVSSTGLTTVTEPDGTFKLPVPNLQAELLFNLPGYTTLNLFLNGRDAVNVSLVAKEFRSFNDKYNTPNGQLAIKDAVYSLSNVVSDEFAYTKSASSDQVLQGRFAGVDVTQQSGIPGQRTYMSIRGNSSFYGNSEPLLIIDGMIHDFSYAGHSIIEGFALNPFDVIDVDDISDITIQKDGLSYLGSAGSNGLININTEQKAETSTRMKFSLYGGLAMTPKNQDVLDQDDFNSYFSQMVASNSNDDVSNYPWLNGSPGVADYYRYNNNTDWQDEIYDPAALTKFHFFLKGGDEIATYNISTGFLSHKGIITNSDYNRYNLRINGLINITDRFSIIPNIKLSLANSRLANQGPSAWKNPILSALLKPSIMASNARDETTGVTLDYLDDVDNNNPLFGVSNPKAIVQNANGTNVNYHFLSSLTAQYKINDHLNLYTLIGLNFNNSRENIFLPDYGMTRVDSAYNSPGALVYEFRSTQNNSKIVYTNSTSTGHNFDATAGFRYLANSYKYSLSTDLNTPSDEFRSLNRGAKYTYLRSTTGDNRELNWIAFYGIFDYNFRNKYYINANVTYDGNSAVNKDHRYNLYPSVGAAWRVSSESFMNDVKWINDLKLRAAYSITGNMYNTIYDHSKLYYTDRRLKALGTVVRESIPNYDMDIEKKNTISGGLDLSLFQQKFNLHVDAFMANVDNMVILQELPPSFGYTDYYDNGGKLESKGIELAFDYRMHLGELVWKIGASVANTKTTVSNLEFVDSETDHIITSVEGAQYITSAGNSLNAFYGYKTDGILSKSEADMGIVGPNKVLMQEGDVKFVGIDDQLVNEDDKTIIGDPNPDLFGGFFTSFEYKRFELIASFNYSLGNDVFNYVRSKTESMDSYLNQSVNVLQRWTSDNTDASMPRASLGDPTGNTVFSDRWIEDGSYLRLGQLTISYELPFFAHLVQGIDLYLTATNLLTITNYSGYDPEFTYMNSPFYKGIDYGKTPQTRSFIMGLKIDL
ncbi:MAG: SusC/RagA family TonB-linked outer membrane protein [Prolixibacteraceae bacterium]|nr:SusC/RagA family TonB-linked outer membrane protein [Prolixibacteraceae bacterium]